MSASGLEVFDKTLQTTNIWLKEIGEDLGPDRQRCYNALRAVLFALRDRLTVDEAADLSAQLPMLIRGIFYEGYRPSTMPQRIRSLDEFLAKINEHLQNIRPLGADEAARAVFRVLEKSIPGGQISEVKQMLPPDIRTLFPGPQQGPLQEPSRARQQSPSHR
ncbi:MAG: DUF2267 domain-containing protein [Hyphomicrobiaceae bacterium]|nr:DUF2267 domain-containing protein [Hyphomicrobiaceae bacterium]